MSRHEIDIEGLPEGWEPVSAKVGCPSTAGGDLHVNAKIFIKRKVRKYDWSKTLASTLLSPSGICGKYEQAGYARSPDGIIDSSYRIATIWQPNIHGKCPVDGEACWVRIRTVNGVINERLAANVLWDFDNAAVVTAWQFIRLAENVEF